MSPIPENREASLPHENCERRGGRHIMVAIDHHADSRRAFNWALTHLIRMADTLHLIYVLPTSESYFSRSVVFLLGSVLTNFITLFASIVMCTIR